MKKNNLAMAKFVADVSLSSGGETLNCTMANYARNAPIAVYMFLRDIKADGPISGKVELMDVDGNWTYWIFYRSITWGILEITQTDNEFAPLLYCGFSNTHSDQSYFDNLGTKGKAKKTLGNSWGGGKA